MQGKEAPEQEAIVKSSVGIDIGKDRLEVYELPGGARWSAANSPAGIRQLKRRLGRFDVGLVVIEATGKWHRPLWRSLVASAIPVAMIDPFKARMFAKATGMLAKTDRLDAALLARFGVAMAPAVRPPPPETLEALAELVVAREAAVAELTGLKNQRAAAAVGFLKKQLGRRIDSLDRCIAALETEIMARIDAEPTLARRYRILASIPGIGEIVATSLVARLAELGSLADKQLTMLAGLAPIADDSAERQGKRSVHGGRGHVRRALYMAALAASRRNPQLAAFYKRLRDAGKPAKLALIAVARKLLLLANALLAQDRLWQPEPPKPA